MKVAFIDHDEFVEKGYTAESLYTGNVDDTATYIKVDFEDGSPVQVHSDAIEPEDCCFYRELGSFISLAEQAYMAGQKSQWLPIEKAPKHIKPMILVRAYLDGYTTDPYAVFWCDGEWNRWPHDFEPTHFMYIPE